VSEHAYELHGEPAELDRLADAARAGEVIYLTRGGQRIAALVPADAAEAMERAEDVADIEAARAALADPGRRSVGAGARRVRRRPGRIPRRTVSSTVDLRPVVRKQLDRITAKDRARILRRLAALADDPRPAGVTAPAAPVTAVVGWSPTGGSTPGLPVRAVSGCRS